ncbi:hypothetical protein [Paraburkholderia sp. GAS42]|jgi:hypothetical protein|uniref:hypothetical protein n=1 Tax=Paraburkholderia sp. GAS42 TaxID=3035135 RepID=UPI003D253BE7
MPLRRSNRLIFMSVAATLLTSAAFAASGGQPLILDTQRGISDGQSGTVLQNAPLSHAPIVQAQPIAAPTELPTNSSTPIIVAPYVDLQAGGGGSPYPRPQPQPQPRPRPRPVPPPQ